MGKILLEGMEFYAYHGCYKEEQVVGNKFFVDLIIETNLEKAAGSDSIHDAVNYLEVFRVVKHEMEIKSKLLEHVARRIVLVVKEKFSAIEKVTVKVSKVNPPLGGQINRVSVEYTA